MTDDLTRRELQCVRLAGEGLTNKEIARRLGPSMSPKTIGNHLSNAYGKIGTSNRRQAALRAAALYPDLSRFGPIPSAPPVVAGSVDGEPGGDPGEGSQTAAHRGWPLPAPPRARALRLVMIVLFAAVAAIFILGVVGVMWASLSLTAPQAPENAMGSISSSRETDP